MTSELTRRTIFGALYVAVLLGATVLGPLYAAIAFYILMIMGILEILSLLLTYTNVQPHFGIALGGATILFVGIYIAVFQPGMNMLNGIILGVSLVGVALMLLLMAVPVILLFRPVDEPVQSWATTLASTLYVALPLSLAPVLSVFSPYDSWGNPALLWPLVLVWINDIGAYLVGTKLGRRKLLKRVSPGKTVEGFIGGIVFTLLGSLAMYSFSPLSFSMTLCLSMGLMVALLGTAGDLVESLIKRQLGVKDSGHFLPGHGGVLDRVDSLLFVMPVAPLLYLLLR